MAAECETCRELRAVLNRVSLALAAEVTDRRREEKRRYEERRKRGAPLGRPVQYAWLKDVVIEGSISSTARRIGVDKRRLFDWRRTTTYSPRVQVPEHLPDLPVKELARQYGIAASTLYRVLQHRRRQACEAH